MRPLGTHTVPFVTRAFPIPRSLLLSSVSYSLYDGEFRYADVRDVRGNFSPRGFGTYPIPEIRFDVTDQKNRADVVRVLSDRVRSEKHQYVRAVVHEDEAYVFPIIIPTTDESVFRNSIEASLEENVPIPPTEAVFEYEVVHIDTVKNETMLSVTVLPEKILVGYASILQEAGLVPISFDTEARCLSRALIERGDIGVHAILHIGKKHSVMAIVERGVVSFSASIGVGSSDIVSVVAKSMSLSTEDAEKIINDRGFDPSREDMRIFDAAMPVLSTLHDEIGKMLVYWKTKSKHASFVPIKDIIVSGAYASMNGLVKYFSVTSRLPARIGSVWTNVLDPKTSLPTISYRESQGYGLVIGALIGETHSFSFLPTELRVFVSRIYRRRLVMMYAVMFFAISCISVVSLVPSYVSVSARLSDADTKKTSLVNSADNDKIIATEKELAILKERIATLSPIGERGAISFVLMKLFARIPDGVTISSVAIKRANGSVIVSGNATNRETLVSFSKSLEGEVFFKKVDLPVSNLAKGKDVPFTLSLTASF